MQSEWIVVNYGREEDCKKIIDAVTQLGRKCHVVSLKQVLDCDLTWSERGLPGLPCAVYGSIMAVEELTRTYGHLSWMSMEKTDCLTYYAHFGTYLLQEPYVMLPLGELRRRWHLLYELMGEDEHLFVRPSANDKSFTAKCIEKRDCVYFEKAGQDPAMLVIVSRPRLITREYRLFMHGKQYLTGSLYKVAGQLLKSPDVPPELKMWATSVAIICHYQGLPPVWVMDVAEVDGQWKVLEVSGSCCAGWYEADHLKIVEAISSEADKELYSRLAISAESTI